MKIVVQMGEDENIVGASMAEAFAHEVDKILQIVLRKNEDYGDAWRQQGWMGNTARILSKTSRLKNLLWRDFQQRDMTESIEDTVQDLIALCVFFLINRGQGNKWGHRASE